MQRQHHEAIYRGSLTEVFAALSTTLAFRRWPGAPGLSSETLPLQRLQYRYQAGSVLRRGQVVEVIRPVALTLHETLDDPPCRVSLKLRFRLDPVDTGTVVRLVLCYHLDRAAQLRPKHWKHRLSEHCRRLLRFTGKTLDWQQSRSAANSNS